MLIIGLMSGTSVDGVDAALVEINGAPPDLRVREIAFLTQPYDDAARAAVLDLCRPDAPLLALGRAHTLLGHRFADATLAVLAQASLAPDKVSLVGSHGQTVYHAPGGERPFTMQIGDPAIIAARTGIPTVADFRAADVAAGGQGAPLVPYPDWLMWHHPTRARALQNIGGIGNVTYLPAGGGPESVVAFDTGPGNVLIDGIAARASDGAWRYDQDGALAARGQVDESLLAQLLAHPYLHQAPPKSTGRETFGADMVAQLWQQGQQRGLSPADLAATVTAFTAASIAAAYRRWLPTPPDEVYVCGGGADNPTLMRMIGERLGSTVRHYDESGYSSAAKEAVAFAVLAYETWHGRPGNLPQVTGASRPVILGHVTPTESKGEPACSPPLEESTPITEARNPRTAAIDTLSALEIARLINDEDARVAPAVRAELEHIAQAVDVIVERLRRGGRLLYFGAGTSGRLGVLDASEMPPTYNTPPDLVQGHIAGGDAALRRSAETAEDDPDAGAQIAREAGVSENDVVVGITASGGASWVLGAVAEAKRCGAATVGITCNPDSPLARLAEVVITPVVGPEVVAGSSRMKAGTAQKLVLNTLSTATMIRLGKVYQNLMVDVRPSNAKLRRRAVRILQQASGADADAAQRALEASSYEVKPALVMLLAGVGADEARRRLAAVEGFVRRAIEATG